MITTTDAAGTTINYVGTPTTTPRTKKPSYEVIQKSPALIEGLYNVNVYFVWTLGEAQKIYKNFNTHRDFTGKRIIEIYKHFKTKDKKLIFNSDK